MRSNKDYNSNGADPARNLSDCKRRISEWGEGQCSADVLRCCAEIPIVEQLFAYVAHFCDELKQEEDEERML